MKTILQLIQVVLVIFAIYCLWHGFAMVVALAAILLAIWAQLIVLGLPREDLEAAAAELRSATLTGVMSRNEVRECTERRNVR